MRRGKFFFVNFSVYLPLSVKCRTLSHLHTTIHGTPWLPSYSIPYVNWLVLCQLLSYKVFASFITLTANQPHQLMARIYGSSPRYKWLALSVSSRADTLMCKISF